MKINLGCGDRYADGWINVDWAGSPHRKDQEVDLTGELPWPKGSLERIYAGHVLEHLTMLDCVLLLNRLYFCSTLGAEIMIVGPDLPTAYRMQRQGTLDVTIDSLLYGAERWSGDKHLWPSSAVTVNEFLAKAGWSDIHDVELDEVAAYWPIADARPRWQFALWAKKETDAYA
jgi:hypothetical protein